MKYYIIAGEASGDLHGSNLIKELLLQDPGAEIRACGGNLMRDAGATLSMHYSEIAFMGFYEVLRNAGKLFGALSKTKKDVDVFKPDVLILIDFAGFNMRMAKWAKGKNLKTYYYISPKIWAWNTGRVHGIKKYVDRMFVILPFETDFFAKFDYKVDFVGNPILDAIRAYKPNPSFRADNKLDDRPIIAILPGSRKQEVELMLHYMVSIIPPYMANYQFVVAGMTALGEKYYELFRRHNTIHIVYDQTYDILTNATAAIVTSGTATLETALFRVPQVVGYNMTAFTYAIARAVIKVKYISLVNLIAGKEVVKELIQDQYKPANIMAELNKILPGGEKREQVLADYDNIINMMGNANASANTARLMIGYLKAGK